MENLILTQICQMEPKKTLDSSLINNLGWKAKTTLEDGLNLTYNWFKKNI